MDNYDIYFELINDNDQEEIEEREEHEVNEVNEEIEEVVDVVDVDDIMREVEANEQRKAVEEPRH